MMRGKGDPGGLAIILDFPSSLSWSRKSHMFGDELKVLNATLDAVGMKSWPIYKTYAVPHKVNKKPTAEEMEKQHQRLLEEIMSVRPKKVLVMGMWAYATLTGKVKKPVSIEKIRGKAEWLDLPDGSRVMMVITIPVYYMTGKTPQRFRDFSKDLIKLSNQDAPQLPMKSDLILIRTIPELSQALDALSKATVVACDLETTGLDPHTDQILAFGLGALYRTRTSGVGFVILPECLALRACKQMLYEFLAGRKASQEIVFHNAKFDLKFLMTYFEQSPLGGMWLQDTILMNYVLDERSFNSQASPHGLKNLSRVRYDADDYAVDFKVFFAQSEEDRDYHGLYEYLALDLLYTIRLYFDLKEEIMEEDEDLWGCYRRLLIPGTFALAEIEYLGAMMDREYLERTAVELEEKLSADKEYLRECLYHLGVNEALVEPFNANSSKQVKEMIHQHLGIKVIDEDGDEFGEFGTDRESLNMTIAGLTQMATVKSLKQAETLKMILQIRTYQKMLSTYIRGPLEALDENDRIHPDFNLNGTETGRLSCQKPNLQNQPTLIGPIIRKAFIAPPGYIFCEVDYSQLELRIGAWYSQDEIMIRAYTEDRDIHKEVAAAAFGVDYEDVTYEQRYAAKYIDFGVIYGRSAHSLAVGPELIEFGWTDDQAQKFIDDFLGQFQGLQRWIDEIQRSAVMNQYVKQPTGRRRRWPFLTTKERGHMLRQAVNTPIQGLASDFTLTALIEIHNRLRHKKSKIVLTVHDSIGFQIAEDEIDEVCDMIQHVMTTHHPVRCRVPIRVDVEIGPNWGELEKWEPTRLPI